MTTRGYATAIHEAGHAVASIHHRIKLQAVTIVQDDEAEGRCLYTTPGLRPDVEVDARTERRLTSLVDIALAGGAAQHHHEGIWDEDGRASDLHSATESASYLAGSNESLEAFLRWRQIVAVDFWKNPLHWARCEAVARALQAQRTLSAREVRVTCQEAIERSV